MRPIYAHRNDTIPSGYFKRFLKMIEEDSEEFFIQTRMRRPVYDKLLRLLRNDLKRKSIRAPVSAECRLTITLY